MPHIRAEANLAMVIGSRCALFCLLISLSTTATAEPPKVDYLFPGGAQRGQSIDVTAGGKFESWPVNATVDRPGLTVECGEDKGKLKLNASESATPGLYWIRLYAPEGATNALPFIVGTLPETEEVEPNNAPSQPQSISSQATVINGRLGGNNDVDTFAVELSAGATLVAAVDAHETLGSPMDTVLQVLSPEGFIYVLQDDERGLDPLCVFTSPSDGVYLVRVFGFPATPNQRITMAGAATFVYRLTLTTAGYLDRSFPLAVNAGAPTAVVLGGWNLPESSGSAMPTVLEDQQLAVVFQPELAQCVPLALVEHESLVESEPNTRETPSSIPVPVTVTGCIAEEDDEDAFQINATSGTTLDIRVESRELGFPLDPLVQVLDADGKVLKEVDDSAGGRDVQFDFAVPADGPLTIAVRDLHRNGGPRYMYRLSITEAKPDFQLTVGGETLSVEKGQSLDIEVTVARARGFAEPIEVTLVELPPGASVEPVTSAPEGDTAKKVTLKLTATDQLFNGPVSVEGRSQGDSSLVRKATSALNIPRIQSDLLWLTVRPPVKK